MSASINTRYAIASATKAFTATAVAGLIGRGRINLHDPLERHLGGLEIRSGLGRSPITVAEALQHRSGIPRHWRNFFRGQGAPPPFEEVARNHAFTTPARGERYLYSNMNYGLLAHAVERVTGQAFHDYLNRILFRPLGLATASSLRAHRNRWTAAIPYEADGTAIPPYQVDEKGARDLVMTASDFARFGWAHLAGHPAIAPDARRLMVSERSLISGTDVGRAYYGLGWIIDDDSPAALFSYGHTGEGPGAASSLAIVPSEELVVATVANAQGAPAYRLNEAIVDALSPVFAERRRSHPFQEPAPDPGRITAFYGNWSGGVETPEGLLPFRVSISAPNEASIEIGGAAGALTRLNVDGGVLSGRSEIQLASVNAARWPHSVRLHLERSAQGLEGTVAAYASKGPIPHDQFWLSYKATLHPFPSTR